MTCRVVASGQGVLAIACTRTPRAPCYACQRASSALCDFPLAGPKTGQTCDRALCESCRVKVGPNRDYCQPHAALGPFCAVVGARTYRALHLVRETVLAHREGLAVASGHAAGVDIVGEITAAQRGHFVASYPATKGKGTDVFTASAMARNGIVAALASEADAFLNDESRGTRDTITKLRQFGKVVRVHEEPPAAEHALLFHTSVHPNTRQAPKGYRGPNWLDITRAGNSPFAPSAPLLSEAKTRMADDPVEAFAWYTPRYEAEMRQSWKRSRVAWDMLLARNHFIAVCYCPDRAQCHRGLFAKLLVKAGEHVGRRVVDGGEVVL